MLTRAGYRALEAGSVAQSVGVARAASGPIDLLISDLVLPDGTGGDVATQVTQLRPTTRVMYVSGYTDDPALRRGISESELEFLSKPFTPNRLLARVRDVLNRQRRVG